MNAEFFAAGDCALTIRLGHEISTEINEKVHTLATSLNKRPIKGVIEWTPAYSELLVEYDPQIITADKLTHHLQKRMHLQNTVPNRPTRTLYVPVCYDGEMGADLHEVAARAHLRPDEVIARHTAPTYRVFMLGFSPGFCYLGGLDPALFTPRKKEPRLKIPAGSVGIADGQTGIYPIESPGGWQLIGRTPVELFSPQRPPHFLFKAGDQLRFEAIDKNAFEQIHEQILKGQYRFHIEKELIK